MQAIIGAIGISHAAEGFMFGRRLLKSQRTRESISPDAR